MALEVVGSTPISHPRIKKPSGRAAFCIFACVSVFLAEKGENPLSLSHRIEKEHHRSGVRKGYSPLVKIPAPFA